MTRFKVNNETLKYGNRSFTDFRSLYDFAVGELRLNGSDVESAVYNSLPTSADPKGSHSIAAHLNRLIGG